MNEIQKQILTLVEDGTFKGKYLEIYERLGTKENIDNTRFNSCSSTAFICTFAGMAFGNYNLMLHGEKLGYEMGLVSIKEIEKLSATEYKITEVFDETIYRISNIKLS